jgi:D-alanyl-lipoteichoic acid acyltransferase DltB (MBOAT superfamily)
MELPENFNAPFEARNLFEFWARWHMTLSEWFKTYLFNPLLTLMASRVTAPAALPYIGVAAFFITFFVMGVWHGSTVVFVIYGLVMGAGVSANKVWQLTLTGRLGKKRYRALGEHWLYAGVARAITTSFFALAVTALWVDLAQLVEIGHRLGVTGVLASFVVIAIGAGLLLPVWDACVRALNAVRASPAARLGKTVVARQFGLGATVLLVLAITSFFHRVPEFVYKAF